jgi:hypothetical protein
VKKMLFAVHELCSNNTDWCKSEDTLSMPGCELEGGHFEYCHLLRVKHYLSLCLQRCELKLHAESRRKIHMLNRILHHPV